MNESATWQVFGYKNSKGKKPKSMGKLYWGDVVDKPEALRRAAAIFCFSTVTDAIATRYTRWDVFVEGMQSLTWVWIPALLVTGGIVVGIHLHPLVGTLLAFFGIAFGVSFAPKSPV